MLKKWQIKCLENIEGWDEFILSASDIAQKKKEQLIEMAKRGEERPGGKSHPLGKSLSHYTSKHANSYDVEFDGIIRELSPKWFVKSADRKKQLLDMAERGESKPRKGHPLAVPLTCYVNQSYTSGYDADFKKKIHLLAPQWFINKADEKKKQLLEMANKGEPRPRQKHHPLGRFLSNYTKKGRGYDKKFDNQIRKLAPHWFIYQTDEAQKKKQELIIMAKRGENRPTNKTSPLSINLGSYTRKTQSGYDSDFDEKIRKLAPHWFKKK